METKNNVKLENINNLINEYDRLKQSLTTFKNGINVKKEQVIQTENIVTGINDVLKNLNDQKMNLVNMANINIT